MYPAALKVEQLDQKHPDYDGAGLTKRRALYEGGKAWRALTSEWLPQHEVEPFKAWEARKRQATYENHFGPALDLLSGHLFTDPPSLEDAEGDYWRTLVSGRTPTTGWARWWRERVTEALWAGRTWVWLDVPATAGPADTLGAQAASGALDAFLRSFEPEAVIDWSTDDRGVAWVRARQVVQRADGPTSPRTAVHRWTCIDREEIAEYEWAPREGENEPGKEAIAYLREGYPVRHGWTDPVTGAAACPVYELALGGALSAGERMEDPAVSHLRGRNEQQHALFRAAVVIMTITAKWGSKQGPPSLGQGSYLELTRDQDGEDVASFLEPPGGVFEHLGADCERREKALYRVVGQMAVAIDPSAAASGDSKRQDWRAMEVVLSALAGVTLDAMRWAVNMIAALRREDPPTVAGLDGWHREETVDWLTGAAMAPELKASPTARKLLAVEQARRLLPDISGEDLEAIQDELEEAAEADAAMMRPAGLGGAGGFGGQPGEAPGAPGQRPGPADGRRGAGGAGDLRDESEGAGGAAGSDAGGARR